MSTSAFLASHGVADATTCGLHIVGYLLDYQTPATLVSIRYLPSHVIVLLVAFEMDPSRVVPGFMNQSKQ